MRPSARCLRALASTSELIHTRRTTASAVMNADSDSVVRAIHDKLNRVAVMISSIQTTLHLVLVTATSSRCTMQLAATRELYCAAWVNRCCGT
jgi:hypothetical protein